MPVLGYWKFKALGQSIRFMLHYLDIDYEDKMYDIGPAPDYSRDSWYNEKFDHDLGLPNLPYYIDGDFRISQSNAILRYIGRKHDLIGHTDVEMVRCDMALEQAVDTQAGLIRSGWSRDHVKDMKLYAEQMPSKLKILEGFLGDNSWFAGENVTIADFRMYEALDEIRKWPSAKDVFEQCSKLSAYMERFESLPNVKTYMSSDAFKELHFFGATVLRRYQESSPN